MKMIKRTAITLALAVTGLIGAPAMASAMPAMTPADGRCVAQGAGFTFDGETKSAVARAGMMRTVILDHAFNNADVVEQLLGIEICD